MDHKLQGVGTSGAMDGVMSQRVAVYIRMVCDDRNARLVMLQGMSDHCRDEVSHVRLENNDFQHSFDHAMLL